MTSEQIREVESNGTSREDRGENESLEDATSVPVDVETNVEMKSSSAALNNVEYNVLHVKPFKAWQAIFLGASVVLSGVAFLLLFSDLPFAQGSKVIQTLSSYSALLPTLSAFSVATTLFFIVFDVRFWSGYWRYAAFFLGLMVIIGWSLTALLLTNDFVTAPISLFLFGSPITLILLKITILSTMDIVTFLRTLKKSLLAVAVLSLSSWLLWIVRDDKFWNISVKLELYFKMGCDETELLLLENVTETDLPNLYIDDPELFIQAESILVGCVSAFVLWLMPFILALWSLVFGIVLHFIVNILEDVRSKKGKASALDPIAQAFFMFIGLGLFGLWAAAGIAGAEMAMTDVVIQLMTVAVILSCIVVVSIFGTSAIQEGMAGTALGKRLIVFMDSDFAKGVIVLTLSPLFIFYLALAACTQASRKYMRCTKTLGEEEFKLIFTVTASKYINQLKKWNWTAVLTKLHFICIILFVLSVGIGRATTLFLSWLNAKLLPLNLIFTIMIFFMVGLVMFLNPLIPGVPVYVAGGIILVSSSQDQFGFWPGVLLTIGICFTLKMTAIVIQQKLIGEKFASNRVWIRRIVNVNSIEIRAIRDILLQPGMTISKVAVLCGGPDWPVSVLTGVLRLPLLSMLFGSLPVGFLIAPCVCAGALLLRSDEGGSWSSLSSIALASASITQSIAMLTAIHFIAKTVISKEQQLKELPDDQEVLALDIIKRETKELRERVSHWSSLGAQKRAMLVLSSFLIASSIYVFFLLGNDCFETFKVSDSIDEVLQGHVSNIVKPLGYYALGLFFVPCVIFISINQHTEKQVRALKRNNEIRASTDLTHRAE